MISIQNKFYTSPGSNCDYYASSDGKTAWFLCTWHPEKDTELEEIQAEIKLEILNAEPLTHSKMEAESWLKSFFAEYHWKLHARLRKSNLVEKGISLFFGLLYERELFFVQFGRIFCAMASDTTVESVGKNWKHYHVKTADELELFGYSERDMRVKVTRILIEDRRELVVVPSVIATKLFDQIKDLATIDALLDSYAGVTNPLWLVLAGKTELQPKKRKKLSRLQISAIVVILITILAVVYKSFGNNFLETGIRKLGMIFQSQKNTSLEKLPEALKMENAKVVDVVDKMLNSAARNIECSISWTTQLPYEVSANPVFDLNNIYLASGKTLSSYGKKERNLLWNQEMSADIVSLTRTKASLIAVLADKTVIGLDERGTVNWRGTILDQPLPQQKLHPIELTNADDARLNSSIIIIPDEFGLSILDSNRGDAFSQVRLKQKLERLSDYDTFDNTFYAIAERSLICIKLKIIN